MLTVLIRALILYIVVLVMYRIMGKKELGQMQPFELVIALLVADLASGPIADSNVPLMYGVIPVITLLCCQTLVSVLTLKSNKARLLINGRPSIVIRDGMILYPEMKRLRYNINDLLEQMRLAGFSDVQKIKIAILETSGQLSVIPMDAHAPATMQYVTDAPPITGLPITIITDGRVNMHNLRLIGQTRTWLLTELLALGFEKTGEVFFAYQDTLGRLQAQGYQAGRIA